VSRWGMLADLERCVGCQTCTAACRHANATSPAVQWRRVLDVEAGAFPDVSRTFVPVGCQHCADPPCVHVCPTTATRQRADGIVTIDYELCIGCAYCEVACPYQARFLVHEPHYAYSAGAMQNETERYDEARIGVAQKCTYCSDRIDFGLAHGLTPGIDPDATPACVNSCIADALHFGDLDDPGSNVSRLLVEQKHFRMHEELGTAPNFHYLYGKAGEAMDSGGDSAAAPAGRVRTRGVEPWHQPHWDWKAAANFLCGGAGAGLFAFAAVASLDGAPVLAVGVFALALIAAGFGILMFKIGRPRRFIYVLRQPQRSWMTREAMVVAVFYPLALAALLVESDALMLVAALVGLVFLFCQAMILKAAKGVPIWRAHNVVPLMLSTGLAEGGGLFLCTAAAWPPLRQDLLPAALVVTLSVVARAWEWRCYLGRLEQDGAPTRSLEILRACKTWFLVLGLIAPLALIALGFALYSLPALGEGGLGLFALAGLLAFATGWALKFIMVTRAAYNQGFALQHTPVRGSGLAGPAVKPGWISP
jgi:phenylacetyl-CoA:acceptor oxidoreductase subunit 1